MLFTGRSAHVLEQRSCVQSVTEQRQCVMEYVVWVGYGLVMWCVTTGRGEDEGAEVSSSPL